MASNNASTQADILWPYLLPKVQRVARTGGIATSGGGNAISGGRLATLQDVNLSNPVDGQVLTYDGVTKMWRNENPTGGSGGGTTYVAGDGIAITGTGTPTIATKQQAAGGIAADVNGLYIKHPSNS